MQVNKKERESNESLIRRFSRLVKQSNVLNHFRNTRFNKREKTKKERREEALYKTKVRKEINKLKKIGKFDEENFKRIKKRIIE